VSERPGYALSHRIVRRLRMLPGQVRARSFGLRGRQVTLGKGSLITCADRITVGDRVAIRAGARLECVAAHDDGEPGRLVIGAGVLCEHRVHLGCAYRIEIGEGTLIASDVTIIDHDHTMPGPRDPRRILDMELAGAPIMIGRNVWLGEKSSVLKGVTIGDGAVVGAHAVVTRDIPARAIAVGIPARVIRYHRVEDALPMQSRRPSSAA
jgi:acetyltransferase-like isoleucine patch superfamily enzyme